MNDPTPKLDTSQLDARVTVDGQEIHWVRNSDPRTSWNKVRVYVTAAEQFNLLEDLTNRMRRPYDAWRPRVLDVLKALGYEDVKIRWSQKAGCSCGCSPGFIIEDGFRYFLRGGGIYIKLTDAPSVDETKPPRDLGAPLTWRCGGPEDNHDVEIPITEPECTQCGAIRPTPENGEKS